MRLQHNLSKLMFRSVGTQSKEQAVYHGMDQCLLPGALTKICSVVCILSMGLFLSNVPSVLAVPIDPIIGLSVLHVENNGVTVISQEIDGSSTNSSDEITVVNPLGDPSDTDSFGNPTEARAFGNTDGTFGGMVHNADTDTGGRIIGSWHHLSSGLLMMGIILRFLAMIYLMGPLSSTIMCYAWL